MIAAFRAGAGLALAVLACVPDVPRKNEPMRQSSAGDPAGVAGQPDAETSAGPVASADGGSGGAPGGDARPSEPRDVRAPDASPDGPPGTAASFRRDIAPLVIKTCGIAGCHVAGSVQWHGMDLVSPEKIRAAWVNTRGFDHCKEGAGGSAEFPMRITPSKVGDRESYILVKVRNTTGLCGADSQRMPLPPLEAWTAAQVEMLRQWVLQGAPNN